MPGVVRRSSRLPRSTRRCKDFSARSEQPPRFRVVLTGASYRGCSGADPPGELAPMGRLDTAKIDQTAFLRALATGLRVGFSEIAREPLPEPLTTLLSRLDVD